MPKKRKLEPQAAASTPHHESSTPSPTMRMLASLGTCFFVAGTFFFTRGLAGHPSSLIFGAVIGLLGLFILGVMASNPEPSLSEAPAFTTTTTTRSKRRVRRRSTTGIRSLRMRRQMVGAGGGR